VLNRKIVIAESMKEDQKDGSPRGAGGGGKQDKQMRRLMVAAKANKVTISGFRV
jgi:hypothetical protein